MDSRDESIFGRIKSVERDIFKKIIEWVKGEG